MSEGIVSSDITFSYGKKKILNQLSFQIPCSSITYLAGDNGAGKTTWIKIAADLLARHEGTVTYAGEPFSKIREQFGIVFDIPAVYPKLSGYDNMRILYDVAINKEAKSLLEDMGFDRRMMRMKAGEYSLGQRHRFGIAGALLRNPRFLFLDEPDIGLDPKAWEMVSDKLLTYKNRGAAILVTGQNFDALDVIADRIVILHNGRTLFEGSTAEFKNQKENSSFTLKQAFENTKQKVE